MLLPNNFFNDPSIVNLVKLAKALEVAPNWLCFCPDILTQEENYLLIHLLEKCKELPDREKRVILETLKRIIALSEVKDALKSKMLN